MKKILVIEDDAEVRTGLIDLLQESGYKVISAPTGKEGLMIAAEFSPDLIICDIMMPGLNGYDVIKELNLGSSTKLIPLIFLTAKGEMTDLRKAMEYGAADYIIKPYDAKALLNAVNVRLEKADAFKNQFRQGKRALKKTRKLTYDDRITLLIDNKPVFIKLSDILCISAENIYSRVCRHGTDATLLIRKPLKKWEEILPESNFIRIHRSTIININYVDKIEKWYKRSFKVCMKNFPKTFIISQRYASRIKSSIID